MGSTGQPTTDVPGENGREPFHMFSAPNGSEGWTQDIGLQGPGSYRVAEALRAPTEQEMANERARRLLSAPDVALATGPVTQELERVANHGLVPNEGYAVFTAYIDDSGLVVSLKVTNMSSSADVRDWDEVARTTLSILEKRKLPMPRGARGVEVSIRVISAVKMPSGSRAPITGQLFGKPDPSSPTVPILSGSFDLSDIGAHPIHTIAAHVESQKIF